MAIGLGLNDDKYIASAISTTQTLTGTVATGSTLVMAGRYGNGNFSSFSDSQSNTYAKDNEVVNFDGSDLFTYSSHGVTGGTNMIFTSTCGSSTTHRFNITEITTSVQLEQHKTNAGSANSSNFSSGNITSTIADAFVFGVVGTRNNSITITPDAAFTSLWFTQARLENGYKIVTATETEAFDGTIDTSMWNAAIIVSYTETSGANLTVSQTEAGDSTTANLEVINEVAVNQSEAGDSTTANLEVINEITASQTEVGDTQTATVVGVVLANITANQTEAGDSNNAALQVILDIVASQVEAGDTTTATVVGQLQADITASQLEAGDTTAATLEVPRNVTANQLEAGDTVAAIIQTVTSGSGNLVITAHSVLSAGNESALPHTVAVSQSGGVSGLTVTARIRDGAGTTSYLDFNDNTFKTSGWTQQDSTLMSLGTGFYTGTINMASITNLPENALVIEYTISGSVEAVVVAPLELVQHTVWGSAVALTLGKFLALKDI